MWVRGNEARTLEKGFRVKIMTLIGKMNVGIMEGEEIIKTETNEGTIKTVTERKVEGGVEVFIFITDNKDYLKHNENGPAYIKYTYTNSRPYLKDELFMKKELEEYHLNGVYLSKNDYYNVLKNKEYMVNNGTVKYYFRGRRLHREDGPAMESDDGIELYFLYGQKVSKEEWEEWRGKRWETKERKAEINGNNRNMVSVGTHDKAL